MKNDIKFVYFDLGGVVVLDFSGTNKWEEMLDSMGVNDQNISLFDKVWDKYHDYICVNKSVEEMVPEFRENVGLDLPVDFSFLKEFTNRFEVNKSIWSVLSEIQKQSNVGLLTNAYIGMVDELYKNTDIMPPIEWDVVVDSSVVNMQKPNKEIYEYSTEKAMVNPSEILFIDNTQKHLEGAKIFGWQTLYYDSTQPEKSSKEILEYLELL